VICRDAVANDQVVKADPVAVVTDHLLLIMINIDNLGNPEAGTLMPRGEVAQRVRHIARVEASRRHLIEQRLECVVREPVEQRSPGTLL
jgi:hypothetical protein